MKAVRTAIAIVAATALQGFASDLPAFDPVIIDPLLPLWGTNGTYKLIYAEPDAVISAHKDYVVDQIDPTTPERSWGRFLYARERNMRCIDGGALDAFYVRSLISMDALNAGDVSGMKALIVECAVKRVKELLYRQGKSFLTQKDGSNPIEPILRPVLTALDAPCCDGLLTALLAIGWNVNVDGVNLLPSGDARITAIAEYEHQILTAVVPTLTDLGMLLRLLGLTKFNQFVQQYNGEPLK